MGTTTAAKVAEFASPSDIFRDLRGLIEQEDEYIVRENKWAFERQVVSTQSDLIEALFEECEKYLVPEKKLEFELQVVMRLSDSIEILSGKAHENSNGNWVKIEEAWHTLRANTKRSKRRYELLMSPSSKQNLEATLWWMAELGVEEDLNFLQQAKKYVRYSSEKNTKRLLDIAEERIRERVNDPDYVLTNSEAAYQRNKEEWDQAYAGQFIAIHHGRVVDSDQDRSKLIERIVKTQSEQGSFRAYIVQVGAPVLKARGPKVRLQGKRDGEAEGDGGEDLKTEVREVSWKAFRRELPRLLEKNRDRWVAFHGERQVALGESKLEVYRQLKQSGYPLPEVVVSRIEPLGPPVDLRRFRRVRGQ